PCGNHARVEVAREERPAIPFGHEALDGAPPSRRPRTASLRSHQSAMHRAQSLPIFGRAASCARAFSLRLLHAPADLALAFSQEELAVRFSTEVDSKRAGVGALRPVRLAETDGAKLVFGLPR